MARQCAVSGQTQAESDQPRGKLHHYPLDGSVLTREKLKFSPSSQSGALNRRKLWISAAALCAIIIILAVEVPRYLHHREWMYFKAICANVSYLEADKWELFESHLPVGYPPNKEFDFLADLTNWPPHQLERSCAVFKPSQCSSYADQPFPTECLRREIPLEPDRHFHRGAIARPNVWICARHQNILRVRGYFKKSDRDRMGEGTRQGGEGVAKRNLVGDVPTLEKKSHHYGGQN
jgi:hypothetical protein